ncbi:MAG: response regulator [Desulfurivibrionaceae bacterium]
MNEKSVLLVDDEKIILVSLSRQLRKNGYEVYTAESGEEGCLILDEQKIDLVVTDLKMEGISGIGVLEYAKKTDPERPVLILTGYGNMDSAIEAMRAGGDDYLLKPCAIDELILRMEQALEKVELKRRIKFYEDILPICSVCKRIRDDSGVEPGQGKWVGIETFMASKAGVAFTHSYCNQCYGEALKDIEKYKDENGK